MIARDVFGAVSERTIEIATAVAPDDAETLTALRAALDAELQAQGWPPLDARVTVSGDGTWRLCPDRAADLAGGHVWIPKGRTYIEKTAEPLSDAWFLARMADRCMRLLDGLRRDDEATVLRDAFQLGADLRELEIRNKALRFAESGKKAADGAAYANAQKGSFKSRHGAEAQARAEAIVKDKPHWSWTLAVKQVAREYGVGFKTAERALKKPSKKTG